MRKRQLSFQMTPIFLCHIFNGDQLKSSDMCSTKPKLPSTYTIGTKYIIQLDKNISLVDFESAQNIFLKIVNLWEEYDSEKIKFWIFELLRQLVRSAKISIYLQVTPKFKRKKTLTMTKKERAILDHLFLPLFVCQVSNGVDLSRDNCQIKWRQCHDKTEEFHKISIFGLVSEIFGELGQVKF